MWLKSLELLSRRLLMRVTHHRNTVRVTSPTSLFEPTSKVLILRHDKIGDAIITLPLLRILRMHYPTLQIDILLSQHNASMSARLKQYTNHCWVYEKSPLKILALLRALRREDYDVILDPMDNASTTSSLIIQLLRCKAIGIEKSNAHVYTYLVPMLERNSVHIIERIAQTLLPFGINPKQESLELEYPLEKSLLRRAQQNLGEKTAPYRFGINISAGDRWRYWGRENFIDFIKQFKARHHDAEMILFSAPSEADEAHAIAEAVAIKAAPAVPSLDEFAAMLVQCDLLLTPDTSVVHIAAAWKVPQVVLYSRAPGLPMVWLPYQSPHRALETSSDFVSAISVESALHAAEALWQECIPKIFYPTHA